MGPGIDAGTGMEAAKVVRALVTLGDLDLLYADRYRDRAETRCAPLCSRSRLAELADEAEALGRLTDDMRRAAEQTDWRQLRLLARRSAGVRAHLEGARELRTLAESVYHARPCGLRSSALALGGVLDARSAETERAAVEEHLRFLSDHDPDWADFYRERLEHFAQPGTPATPMSNGAAATDALRRAVLVAIERTDYEEVDRLLDGAEEPRPASPLGSQPRMPPAPARHLDAPFAPTVLGRAEALGLEPVGLAAQPALAQCLTDWCRRDPSDGAESPIGSSPSECGRPCPVLGRQALWESLNSLVARPHATSAGTPYLPRFDAERMLVETFAEDAPDGPSALLTLLELPRRRALSRTTVEQAIRTGTARVCAALGLDAFEFTVTAIPFDAYLRLAPQQGWGRRALWTHFDGYQVTPAHTLRALVGGDERYGGADGLYAVGRDYDGDHLLARFAVLHRQRFL